MSRTMLASLALLLALCCARGQLRFMALGDWGGQDAAPMYTAAQKAAAEGMGVTAAAIGATFTVALGDNFYTDGIHTDAGDGRFRDTFESVYSADALQHPWYIAVGNHDWRGNVTAQMEYAKRSDRWTYPDYWYAVTREFTASNGEKMTFELLVIDTVLGFGHTEDHPFSVPQGPFDQRAAGEQLSWLESRLAASTADFLWVGGHFPVYSACSHGSTPGMEDKIRPLLERYRATGSMAGHDHCQEYVEHNSVAYVLTGTGVECCYNATNEALLPKDSLKFIASADHPVEGVVSGYASFQADHDGMVVVLHDQDSNAIYTSRRLPRRGQAAPSALSR